MNNMIPIPLAGIAVTGSALLAKYAITQKNRGKTGSSNRMQGIKPVIQLPAPIKLPDIQNQLHTVISGLTSAVSQVTRSIAGEDYNKIVKDFLPEGAVLIKPKHFSNSGELGLSDLDGDSKDELLASYRSNCGVGTIALKKEGEQWYKTAELTIPGYSALDFRDTSSIAGTGGQQLLLGFPGQNKTVDLHAYSLENGSFNKLFECNCNRFEILGGGKGEENRSKQEQLAFWNKDANGRYTVEVYRWNGLELEPVKDKSKYYLRKVIPVHAKLVKHNPHSPVGWYNLADTLADAGYTDDALAAAETGRDIDKDGVYAARYDELKKRL